jgi:hypothetical protein
MESRSRDVCQPNFRSPPNQGQGASPSWTAVVNEMRKAVGAGWVFDQSEDTVYADSTGGGVV